jgi:HAE1 family hydrophobic/amphiphilic exporter-1
LSLNLLTLGGLAIAVGRVIDDSIVILENIYRHIQEGEPPLQAALNATSEVGGAVAASTITSLAVFVPLAFVGGIAGEFFRPLGLAILYAIAASLVVAFTVVPLLAARALKPPPGPPRAPGDGRIAWLYRPTLRWVLDRPGLTILLALAVSAGGFAIQGLFGKVNFFAAGPSDTLIASMNLPPGSTLETTRTAALPLEEAVAGLSGIHTVATTIGSSGFFAQFGSNVSAANQATVRGYGDPALTRQALAELRAALAEFDLAGAVTARLRSGGAPQGNTIDLVVEASDPGVLAEANRLVFDALRPLERLANVTSSLTESRAALSVTLEPRSAALGILPMSVAGALRAVEGGPEAGTIELDGRPVPIVIRETETPLLTSAALAAFLVPAPALGTAVPLGSVARIVEAPAPASITRTAGQRTAIVSGDIVGDDNSVAQRQVSEALAALRLPAGVSTYVTGVVAQQAEAFGQLGIAIAISIFLVYTCMVAAFRSLLTPLLLLVAIPLAAAGAFPLLVLTGTPLGLSPILGLLLLVGVVVTNSIVLIDLVEQYRSQGMDVRRALIEGGARRVRPILMTAVTTIVGLLPLALGLFGQGGGFISAPLAITVMGGLISSTFLTLVVLPVLYIVFNRGVEPGQRPAAEG